MRSVIQICSVVVSSLVIFGSCLSETTSTLSASHPPVPTASWPPLPSSFNDIPSKSLDCWNSQFSFSFTTYFLWTEAAKSITPIVTTFVPPRTHNRTYTYEQKTNCSTTNFGLTTLCDGIPRAESRSATCRTTQVLTSDVWIESSSTLDYNTATWTSEFRPPQPSCKVAEDGSLLCDRIYDAYSYRASQLKSETTLDPSYLGTLYNMIGPHCTRSDPSETTYTGTMCRMVASTYSAYYWPTPAPTGSEFCESSKPTSTITEELATTVISGHTLTSPSVYHFMRDARIESYLFDQQRYNLSVAVPSDLVLTVAQLESDILSASITCRGHELDYCTAFFIPDFRVNDISTARADAYVRNCGCGTDTIYQSNYKPSVAVPVSDVVKQNPGIGGKDCDWDLWGGYSGSYWNGGVESSVPALVFENMPRTSFLPIARTTEAGTRSVAATPVPRNAATSTLEPTVAIQ
ncbi:unnamed protein product [Periconia digitata]|uniref:Uncharacterized protein n=1 Tax=Periconia digitata TaxID=1303443 RepID=A0A9W4U9F3_9PLEO|nr:unnamed protein product [Periconia digitata]